MVFTRPSKQELFFGPGGANHSQKHAFSSSFGPRRCQKRSKTTCFTRPFESDPRHCAGNSVVFGGFGPLRLAAGRPKRRAQKLPKTGFDCKKCILFEAVLKLFCSVLGARFPHAGRGLHRLEALRTELARVWRSGPSPEGLQKGPPEGRPNRPKRVSHVKNASFCEALLLQLWASRPRTGCPLVPLFGPKGSLPRGPQSAKRQPGRGQTRRSYAFLLKLVENDLLEMCTPPGRNAHFDQ